MEKVSDDLLQLIDDVQTLRNFDVLNDMAGENSTSVSEDWQLSQFWYNDETITALTTIVKKLLPNNNSSVALLSCPSLYEKFKCSFPTFQVKLFEYDKRFSKYGQDFIYFDYKMGPECFTDDIKSGFDVIVADPPFLSKECIEKYAKTVKCLMKNSNSKILFCSGKSVDEYLKSLLGLKMSETFEPQHTKKLANEFALFTNFDFDLIFSRNFQ